MALVAYATTGGPGVGGDATIYLTTAQNLLNGKGLLYPEADGSFRLLPYTPPFYPLALSGVGLLVKDMVAGARWLNILLFGATIVLTGWFFYRATARPWLAVILSGVLATSPVILGVQVWAMSEAIFLFLGFAGLFALLGYFDRPQKRILAASAVLCGLAFLTRYIGVAFVGTAVLALLLLTRAADGRVQVDLTVKGLRGKFQAAFWFGLIAVLPTLIWLVIDYVLTGTIGSRSGQPAAAYWQRFLEIGPALQKIYLFWLLPDSVIARLPNAVQAALWFIPLAALVALGAALTRRLNRVSYETGQTIQPAVLFMTLLFGLFILVFLAVLAVVQVFTYPPITLASRMLSPVHIAVLVLAFLLLHLVLGLFFQEAPKSRPALAMAYLACLGLLGVYALRGGLVVRDYHLGGIGYSSPAWREMETIARLRNLPAGTLIVSNETTAILFLTGRPAYPIQEIYQDRMLEPFTVYGAGEDAAQQAFRNQSAALVLFSNTLYDDFAMYADRTDERLSVLTRGLYPYYVGNDGAIYFYKAPGFVSDANCD